MAIKLAIGTPAYRGIIASGQSRMWLGLGVALGQVREHIELVAMIDLDMNGIDNARNTLLDAARDAKADWLLMLDSDTWCEPGKLLVRMILDAEARSAAIVAAPVAVRGVASGLNVKRWIEEEGRHRDYPPESWETKDYPFVEVDAVGAAIMAIHTERCGEARFRFIEKSRSEDIEFCYQVRKSGGLVLLDPRFPTYHVNKPDVLVYGG